MNGVNLAEAGHPINALPPQTISGGATAQAFSMKGAEHVSIFVIFGQLGGSPVAVPTSVQVNQCTDANGDSALALVSFRYYYQLLGGAGNDVLNGAQQALANQPSVPPNYTATSSGIVSFPAGVSNGMIVIEIDAAELEVGVQAVGTITERPYLQVVIANGAYATYVNVLAVLTGQRFSNKEQLSQTV